MSEITTTGLTAHPARPANGYPHVQGRCPACGMASLFLGSGGYVTCASLDCTDPAMASEVNAELAAVERVIASAQHPALREETLADDVHLIWRGRTQAREACEALAAERDAARAEVMAEQAEAKADVARVDAEDWVVLENELNLMTRRAEQAEAALARVREAVTEYMDALGGQVPLYYQERIQAALDGGDAP